MGNMSANDLDKATSGAIEVLAILYELIGCPISTTIIRYGRDVDQDRIRQLLLLARNVGPIVERLSMPTILSLVVPLCS
jgi:hypothetical protein